MEDTNGSVKLVVVGSLALDTIATPVATPAPSQPLTEKEAQERSRAALEQRLKELDSPGTR